MSNWHFLFILMTFNLIQFSPKQYLGLLSRYGICLPLALPKAKCIFVATVSIMLSSGISYSWLIQEGLSVCFKVLFLCFFPFSFECWWEPVWFRFLWIKVIEWSFQNWIKSILSLWKGKHYRVTIPGGLR